MARNVRKALKVIIQTYALTVFVQNIKLKDGTVTGKHIKNRRTEILR